MEKIVVYTVLQYKAVKLVENKNKAFNGLCNLYNYAAKYGFFGGRVPAFKKDGKPNIQRVGKKIIKHYK